MHFHCCSVSCLWIRDGLRRAYTVQIRMVGRSYVHAHGTNEFIWKSYGRDDIRHDFTTCEFQKQSHEVDRRIRLEAPLHARKDHCMTLKYCESDKRAHISNRGTLMSYRWSFCAALLQVERTWYNCSPSLITAYKILIRAVTVSYTYRLFFSNRKPGRLVTLCVCSCIWFINIWNRYYNVNMVCEDNSCALVNQMALKNTIRCLIEILNMHFSWWIEVVYGDIQYRIPLRLWRVPVNYTCVCERERERELKRLWNTLLETSYSARCSCQTSASLFSWSIVHIRHGAAVFVFLLLWFS